MRLAVLWAGISLALLGLATQTKVAATDSQWIVALAEVGAGLSSGSLAFLYALRALGWSVETWLNRPGGRGYGFAVLLTPYRVLAWVTLLVASWVSREPPFTEVAPGLLVGRRPFRWERQPLQDRGLASVLDLCAELPSHLDQGSAPIPTERCPILDGMPPTSTQFQFAVDWASAEVAQGRAVLIHCAQGHGRSATVAAVILVQLRLSANLDEALTRIQKCRPGAHPSRAQRRAATDYVRATMADGSRD